MSLEAWEIARPDCEPYFQGYGDKSGGIESFLKLKPVQREMPDEDNPTAFRKITYELLGQNIGRSM